MRQQIVQRKGGYQARILGNNGEIVFWSEEYADKTGAQHALALVQGAQFSNIEEIDLR